VITPLSEAEALQWKFNSLGVLGIDWQYSKYEWPLHAKAIHAGLRHQEAELKKLLAAPSELHQLVGVLLLLPAVWDGSHWFLPQRVLDNKDETIFRRSYATSIEKLARSTTSTRVRACCLAYYYYFPDLIVTEAFVNTFDFKREWGNPAFPHPNDPRRLYLGELIVNKEGRFTGAPLGEIAFKIFCRAYPRKGLQLALRSLQHERTWWRPIVQTEAKFALSPSEWRLVKGAGAEPKRALGLAAGLIVKAGRSYEAFKVENEMVSDIEFPRQALSAILADDTAAPAFCKSIASARSPLEKPFPWSSASPKQVLDKLEEEYNRGRREYRDKLKGQ
jgi:hypothetical protein